MPTCEKLFLLFFLIVTQLFFCQNETDKQIRELLEKSKNFADADDKKSLKYALQAYNLAIRKGTSENISKASLEVAYTYFDLDQFKESIPYIRKGLREKATQENLSLLAEFKDLEAYNYGYIGLKDQELKILNDIEKLILEKNEDKAKPQLAYNYLRISDIHFKLNDLKQAELNINKALKIINQIHVKDITRSYILNSKGYICLEINKLDSAFYYFNKDYQEIVTKKQPSEIVQLTALGDYYKKQLNFDKALEYYFKALNNIDAKKITDLDYEITIHKNISEIYHIIGDNKNEKIHLKKNLELEQKYNNKKNENTQAVFYSLTNDFNDEKTNLVYSILIISSFSLIIIIIFIYRIKRIRKRKRRLILEKEKLLLNKDSIITEKENLAKVLEQKLEFSLDDIREVAKNNDAAFFVKFQKFYPEFTQKVLHINPNLISTELNLLAYIYLNFSSKEIAEYTFKSLRTIESRKYHLRKKINLDTHIDLYTWLRKIC